MASSVTCWGYITHNLANLCKIRISVEHKNKGLGLRQVLDHLEYGLVFTRNELEELIIKGIITFESVFLDFLERKSAKTQKCNDTYRGHYTLFNNIGLSYLYSV